jgi:hypothetical protein
VIGQKVKGERRSKGVVACWAGGAEPSRGAKHRKEVSLGWSEAEA